MKKLLLSLVIMLALNAFAQDAKVITDANATVRTLNAGFTAVEVSSGINLYITQGNAEAIAVSATEQKYQDRIKTEVVNGVLKIYYDNKGVTWKPGDRKLKAYVSCKTLQSLNTSAGSVTIVIGNIQAENFKLDVGSGSDFTGALQVKTLVTNVNSGASVKISGKADKLIIDVSSGADFKGYDLVVDFCEAKASSGAEIHVTINKELSARASSGADIKYKGTGLIRDIKTSGGGSVKKV